MLRVRALTLPFFLTILCGSNTFASSEAGLDFAENKGQWPAPVKYRSEFQNGSVFFLKDRFTLVHCDRMEGAADDSASVVCRRQAMTISAHAYSMSFLNAQTSEIVPANQQAYYHNYYLTNDRSRWAGNVSLYKTLSYKDLYEGIDMMVYSLGSNLKYDFIVQPTGDPGDIQIEFEGATPLLSKDGDLLIQTTVGRVVERLPYVYQIINGLEVPVSCKYSVKGCTVGFEFPNGYDVSRTLIIDPILIFATYSGSTGINEGYCATYDNNQNLYSASNVFATDWPATVGAFQSTLGSVGINKYDASGSTLLYSTYYGSSSSLSTIPHSLFVNSNNELVIFGVTSGPGLPVTMGCYDSTYNGTGGTEDIFVAHFDSTGSSLVGATYIGGSGKDGVSTMSSGINDKSFGEVISDLQGNIYVSTTTQSSNFPVTPGAYQTIFGGGGSDGCLFKLNSTCSNLLFSTFLGGTGVDECFGNAFSSSGFVFVGHTTSQNFPTTLSAYSTQGKSFVGILDTNGASLISSSLLGLSTRGAYRVAADYDSDIYIAGYVENPSAFTASPGTYAQSAGDIFIMKLNPTLTSLFSKTKVASHCTIAAFQQICENVVLCTAVGVPFHNLSLTPNAYSAIPSSFYLLQLNPQMSTLVYSTFLGSPYTSGDNHLHCAGRIDDLGNVYQASCGKLNNYFTTPGSWSPSSQTGSNGRDNACFKFDFEIPVSSVTASYYLPDTVCSNRQMHIVNNSTMASSYIWDFGDGSSDTVASPFHIYTVPGTYIVKLIAFNPGLCIPKDSLIDTVYVMEVPNPIIPISDTLLCTQNVVTITAETSNNTGFISFRWSPGHAILSDSNLSSVLVDPQKANLFVVTVSDSLPGKCIGIYTDTVNITIFDSSGLIAYKDTIICAGDTILISAKGGNSYYWDNEDILPYQGDSVVAVWPSRSTNYSVVIEGLEGCSVLREVKIDVDSVVANAGPDRSIQPGERTVLMGSGGGAYNWYPVDNIIDPNSQNPIVSPAETTTYYLEVSSSRGCRDTDTVMVYLQTVYIPSAFSPNGDGLNDRFGLISTGTIVKLNNLSVYNRWGERVFVAWNLNERWDGTYKQMPCDIGTYHYLCTYEIEGRSYKLQGDISLLR